MLFSLRRLRHSQAFKTTAQRQHRGSGKPAVFLWIADLTGAEDVLGTVAEPGHSKRCAAVHAGPKQRWASLVCRCGPVTDLFF